MDLPYQKLIIITPAIIIVMVFNIINKKRWLSKDYIVNELILGNLIPLVNLFCFIYFSKNFYLINKFISHIENIYEKYPTGCGNSFDEILCYELDTQPINPRMECITYSGGFDTGLTFKELAQKWGITCTFLGKLIANHCKKLD